VYSRLAGEEHLAKQGYTFKKALWSANLGYLLCDVIAKDLKLAVLTWAARFHADADWLVLGALRSLDRWYQFPDYHKSLAWTTLHERSEVAVRREPFEFRYSAWDVHLQSWGDYRAALFRRLGQQLMTYERRNRELAKSEGLIPTSKKASQVNLVWFVRYQFAGESSVKIANANSPTARPADESTVLKGIKAAAKRIVWKHLREPARKGRPENSSLSQFS